MAKVSCEYDGFHTVITTTQFGEYFSRLVAAAIVHKQELPLNTTSLDGRGDSFIDGQDILTFIEAGEYDRQEFTGWCHQTVASVVEASGTWQITHTPTSLLR